MRVQVGAPGCAFCPPQVNGAVQGQTACHTLTAELVRGSASEWGK